MFDTNLCDVGGRGQLAAELVDVKAGCARPVAFRSWLVGLFQQEASWSEQNESSALTAKW